MKSYALLPLLAAPLVSAHYDLVWPPPRSTSHSDEPKYPCGGVNTPSASRTRYPLSGGPLQLSLGHTNSKVQVVLAVGDNPTDGSFTRTVVPAFQVSGVKNFCIGKDAFSWPSDLKDGTNATIQVITNGDPSGGLYQCADVTFTSATLSDADYSSHCQNATGIQVRPLAAGTQANGTAAASGDSGADDDGDDDGSAVTTLTSGGSTITSTKTSSSSSGSAAAATTTTGTGSAAANQASTTTTGTTASRTGLAAHPTVFGWGIAAAGVAAGVFAL